MNINQHRVLQLVRFKLYVLVGISQTNCKRLKQLQNCAAKLVFCASKSDHVTPLISDLHWLTVTNRIKFKLLTLV